MAKNNEPDIPDDPHFGNIHEWSIRMQACRELLTKLKAHEFFLTTVRSTSRKEGKVYQQAVLKLLMDSKENMAKFYYDTHEIRYRNHVRDKKGKLINVEAYFFS